MLNVFISQPMRGRRPAEIDEERKKALEHVAAAVGECREIPSHFDEAAIAKMSALDCLGNSIKLLSHADLAVFVPGWIDARGCKIEYDCAVQYGIPVLVLDAL